ncbi:hypothetical protein [Gorillibacterium sp. sgz5001074]|uniref:hypothetical protein n=1 Tax=Gorillibacterium sp. sgz5001074 TaxID=3446695 RepID=UPI003F6716FF
MGLTMLGQVPIAIQNDDQFNEDVYTIRNPVIQAAGLKDEQAVARLIEEQGEEPERYVVLQGGSGAEVSTKQPDAVIQLALMLNRRLGSEVEDEEVDRVRELLILLQKGRRDNYDPLRHLKNGSLQ